MVTTTGASPDSGAPVFRLKRGEKDSRPAVRYPGRCQPTQGANRHADAQQHWIGCPTTVYFWNRVTGGIADWVLPIGRIRVPADPGGRIRNAATWSERYPNHSAYASRKAATTRCSLIDRRRRAFCQRLGAASEYAAGRSSAVSISLAFMTPFLQAPKPAAAGRGGRLELRQPLRDAFAVGIAGIYIAIHDGQVMFDHLVRDFSQITLLT
jgi:hypothetical protein